MNLVLVTTTIYPPEILRSYRSKDPDVEFIIAGDKKTPNDALRKLEKELEPCTYLSPETQESLYPDLSDAIGWNCVQRRNFAFLEAARSGADIIISVDDDNKPLNNNYFDHIRQAFSEPYIGNIARGAWFNLGELADEKYTYRGYPFSETHESAFFEKSGKMRDIGILNGLIYEDPDINAVERLMTDPMVEEYETKIEKLGVAFKPGETWAPVNSQNTAWRAELLPLMMVLPEVGRYDDIWGSYIAQRVLAATDYHVLYGKPFVRQDRHTHDVLDDLQNEMFGMRYTERLIEYLEGVELDENASIMTNLRTVLESEAGVFLPRRFFQEWMSACGALLGEPV